MIPGGQLQILALCAYRYRTEENAVYAEMKKISDERVRVKGIQDETYVRMRLLKTDKYGKTKVWGENRCARVKSQAGLRFSPKR